MSTTSSFIAKWYAIGIGYDGAGLYLTGGSSTRYGVNWGDGSKDIVKPDHDDNGDGTFDNAQPFHNYAADGTYDVIVSQIGSGLPPEHLRAFAYARSDHAVTLDGTNLDDVMLGSSLGDTLHGGNGDDALQGNGGDDKIFGGAGDDFLIGDAGDDIIHGGDGIDLVTGGDGNDLIYGDADTDYLYGAKGNDVIYGGDGDDYLNGEEGADRLYGDAGADTFAFSLVAPENQTANPGRDRIMDFQQGTDHISVGQLFPTGYSFIGTHAFDGAGPELRFSIAGSDTTVFADMDGDKHADFSFIVSNAVVLTQADFVG